MASNKLARTNDDIQRVLSDRIQQVKDPRVQQALKTKRSSAVVSSPHPAGYAVSSAVL